MIFTIYILPYYMKKILYNITLTLYLGLLLSDDIIENAEDTMTLLERYIDELPVDLSKDRLKNTMRTLYTEAQDLEI